MKTVFAQRLKAARKIRCMSQRDLCNALEGKVSSSAVEKYEKGLMMPSSDVLILIANVLGMNIDYFFTPLNPVVDPNGFKFKKSTGLSAKQVSAIKHQVCSEIEKYLQIESVLGRHSFFPFNYSDSLILSEKDARDLASRVRCDLNVALAPIVSVVSLLEFNGIMIIDLELDDDFSGTCTSVQDRKVIVINSKMSSEKTRYTLFHELGHLLMNFAVDVDEEKLCNAFADEMLIPSDRLLEIMGNVRNDISLSELASIQKEYGVSIDVLMNKACQLGIITNRRYTLFRKKMKDNESFKAFVDASRIPADQTVMFVRLVYRALCDELITFSKAASYLNISINELRDALNCV